MTLQRVLEPEVMDTPQEAHDYNVMDHSQVNRVFVDDLLACRSDLGDVLDLGTGTALIPIELCQRTDNSRVMAADLSTHMLDLARYNIEIQGLIGRITLTHVDAKRSPFQEEQFDVVMSNSIIHHVPDPLTVLQEAVRIVKRGGLLFFRDLLRPADEPTLESLVATYAAEANEHQRQMFAASLHAALTLDEIRALIGQLGFAAQTVQATSDRHWTWSATKP